MREKDKERLEIVKQTAGSLQEVIAKLIIEENEKEATFLGIEAFRDANRLKRALQNFFLPSEED